MSMGFVIFLGYAGTLAFAISSGLYLFLIDKHNSCMIAEKPDLKLY